MRNQGVKKKKTEKGIILENFYKFFKGREIVLDAFERKIFLTKSKGANLDRFKLKILTLNKCFKNYQ